MRDPRHPRHFTDEFKRQIVGLHNAGKPNREAMDEYGLGKSTVERWAESISATGSPRAAGNRTPGLPGVARPAHRSMRSRPSCLNCSIFRAHGVHFQVITRTTS